MQKIMAQRSGKSPNEDRSARSSENYDLNSPAVVKAKLNASINKSSSLMQSKSIKNIDKPGPILMRKSSSK